MINLSLSPTVEALAALAIVATMFILFLREEYPAEVVAISGAAAMLIFGFLPYETALNVLSNPAPWTIGAMFIVMGALVRTGVLEVFTKFAEKRAATQPKLAVASLMVFVVLSSAIVSNTPVVVVMIPVFVQLARVLGTKASKMLIPLSYAAILGGTLTLIGTSTNLLVDGVAQAQGMKGFSIFEVTPLAIILVIYGMAYLYFMAGPLLPERDSMADLLGGGQKKKFFTEMAVPENSGLIGQLAIKVGQFKREGVRLVDVLRGDKSLRRQLKEVELQAGDRVVLKTEIAELMGLKDDKEVHAVDQLSSVETAIVEVLISPGCKMIGRKLGDMRLRRSYGVYPLAVHRRNQNIGRQLDDVVVKVGDTILMEGSPSDIQRMANDMRLVDLTLPTEQAFRRNKVPIAVLALFGIVLIAAFNIAPIFLAALGAVALVLITRCIDAEEAFSFIDGRLLALIFSMLTIGATLENTGAVELIVGKFAPGLALLPPFLIVWAIYLLTSVLTEMVSNNAVAVVITPIAISLGLALGIDPRPLVVAVMVAASASFATPIGYQTNMMVYGPGGYKFSDFLKTGIPLNLTLGILASALIPFFWPL
ncbi:trkA domain protein [Rhodobacterales bacterium HTCC2150]|nr:trkA domain protein [Rhodobacterales bacterium HTCC2150] [Rhodobacteraceae bacterium HTCC2150]